MLDPYASCPCGSGKKFKFCCIDIHGEIDKAMVQQQNGQHEAALRTIDEVVKAHPKNPEALGRNAQLLHVNGRADEAEKALDAAFEINPSYPYGYLLRGLFRLDEGEREGAMLLFRKAVELYASDAMEQLAFLYEQIGNFEMGRNNLVAARYAFAHCVRLMPENGELRQAFDAIFGADSRTPLAARQEYRLQGAGPKRPIEWQEAMGKGNAGKLSEAVKLFENLAKQPKADPLASYNAGLLRAWQGESGKAIAHLQKYVEKEADESKAVAAWALCEVLRMSDELLEQADYVTHRHLMRFGNPNAIVSLIQDWDRAGRLVGVRSDEQNGTLAGMLLQETTGLIGAAAPAASPVAAQFAIVRDTLSLTNPNRESLDRVVIEVKQSLGANILEERSLVDNATFGTILQESVVLPPYSRVSEEFLAKMSEQVEIYFEEIWPSRPLKSLDGNTPAAAAGQSNLRRRLLGDILFLEQCYDAATPKAEADLTSRYDFGRLRAKLGVDTEPPPPQIDFTGMNATDFAAIEIESLSAANLEKAFRAAVAIDAREQANRFVRALIARPVDPQRPDLFAFYKYLIDQAQTQANWDDAIKEVDAGLQADIERNNGLRRGDYELRRAQLFAKKGDAEKAQEAFAALIARLPNEIKYRGNAAEAMLTLRQGEKARTFAEEGLAEARKQGNRDLEAYLQELIAASKKLGG